MLFDADSENIPEKQAAKTQKLVLLYESIAIIFKLVINIKLALLYNGLPFLSVL